ncbi:hypothetical protein EYR40_000542 [Pleurotus pulmonarius]|nr:hypothetical protein EYR40_000542 [Pleurotus pulmonarius]
MSCPDCKKGNVLPGEPTGSISTAGAYYAPGPSPHAKRAVLLLTDVFGLPLKNSKLIADALAKRLECDVWVPDLFAGKPILGVDQLNMPDRPGVKIGFFGWVRFFFSMLPSIPAFIQSRAAVVDQRVNAFIQAVQAEKKYEKLGAVGYCFGGVVAVRFGATDLLDSIVVVHPGPVSLEQIRAIKVPAAWVCAQEDFSFSDKLREEAEAVFAGREGENSWVDYEFTLYPGTVHGFGARPNLDIPEIKEAFEKSQDQIVNWFNKTIPAS